MRKRVLSVIGTTNYDEGVSYKVVGYTEKLWRWIKYPTYLAGFSFIMGWIVWQNYTVLRPPQYLDIMITAWITMSIAVLCWLVGVAGIAIDWIKEVRDE